MSIMTCEQGIRGDNVERDPKSSSKERRGAWGPGRGEGDGSGKVGTSDRDTRFVDLAAVLCDAARHQLVLFGPQFVQPLGQI